MDCSEDRPPIPRETAGEARTQLKGSSSHNPPRPRQKKPVYLVTSLKCKMAADLGHRQAVPVVFLVLAGVQSLIPRLWVFAS